MGILKGDVDLIGLGSLLQALSMNGRQGVLTLYQDMDKKTIHFGPHGMRLLSTTMKRPNKLGKILMRRRMINPQVLKRILEDQRTNKAKLGEILVKGRLVDPSAIKEALREQIEEEIFDMFMWENAAFEFIEGPPKKAPESPLADIAFDANITSIILEAARRSDELKLFRRLVNDDGMILVRTTHEIYADLLGEDQECVDAIFPLINAKRAVREIVLNSIYPRFATLRALYRLIKQGFVKSVSATGSTVIILPPKDRASVPPSGTHG